MSPLGRAEAAQRWHDGDHGPDSAMARSTKRVCRDCGFYLPLSGELGTMFGVCGNELSADGQVVDIGYGCGAHSDTPAPAGTGSPAYEPYDDGVLEILERDADAEIVTVEPAEAPAEAAEAAVEPAEAPAEAAEAVAEPAEAPAEPAEVVAEAPVEAEPAPEPAEPEIETETDVVAVEASADTSVEAPAEPGESDTP
jgi:hypothetical protein